MKKFAIIAISIFVVIVATTLFSEQKIQQPANHTWDIYEDEELGFVIAYPSDISESYKVKHLESVDGTPLGADTVQFLDAENRKVIFLWVKQTEARDIDEWFNTTYGEDGSGHVIVTTTTIAGKKAIQIREEPIGKALSSYNLHFIEKEKVYSMYLHDSVDEWNMSVEDVNYIKQSFHFKTWLDKVRDLFKND